MDLDALVEELAKRVLDALNGAGTPAAQGCANGFCTVDNDANKPILIGLTQDSDLPPCRFTLLDSAKVKEKYRIICAQKNDYQVDLNSCAGVVLHDLTNQDLAKIATGICDTPYTQLVSKALLLGKPVYLLQDQIELYNYRQTAAKAYYKMFRAQLGLLEQSGLMICCPDKIEGILVDGAAKGTTCGIAAQETVTVSGHLISQRTVADAHKAGAAKLVVEQSAIITDLALEYAQKYQIQLIRQ